MEKRGGVFIARELRNRVARLPVTELLAEFRTTVHNYQRTNNEVETCTSKTMFEMYGCVSCEKGFSTMMETFPERTGSPKTE